MSGFVFCRVRSMVLVLSSGNPSFRRRRHNSFVFDGVHTRTRGALCRLPFSIQLSQVVSKACSFNLRIEDALTARGWALACAGLALMFVALAPARAVSEVFDIPAQSLATAIDAFCATTGAEVYYDGAAAQGLRSSAVSGDHARERALSNLLIGTNLVPLRGSKGAYLLVNPGDDAAQAMATAKASEDARYRQYFAVVQRSVSERLCRFPNGSPSAGRMVIRFWIDPAGAVRRLETDDDGSADTRITDWLNALRSLRLPEAPPQHMPQPVTVAFLPTKTLAANFCPPTADVAVGR